MIRRWIFPIGTSHCGSEVGCYDWYTVLCFGSGLLQLVHHIVVRRWVVTIGPSHCDSEVGCSDWYTVLWFGDGLL